MKIETTTKTTSIFILLISSIYLIDCFNFDTTAPVFKQANTNINIDLNENDIYFGYSIAQHFQKKDKQPL
jgi:hypothetical protein